MKPRDRANLLNRAAAAIETPDDLTDAERAELVEDLTNAATEAARAHTTAEIYAQAAAHYRW